MLRLMALLCGGIYVAMLVGGQDRGQLRFGLMEKPAAPQVVQAAEAAPVAPAPQVVAAAFVPEKPVMVQPVVEAAAPAPVAEVPLPIMYIAAASANVREGPGKDHAVLGRLTQGEAVSVVVAGEGPDSWSLIRIEGDGLEGYVANRLLTE